MTNDLEVKMLALLERWVDKFNNLPSVESCKSHGMWIEDSAEARNHRKLWSLLSDTKTLLKEAKVVKHGKD